VIATRPATAPDEAPTQRRLPFLSHSTRIQPIRAAAVATWVLTNAIAVVLSVVSSGAGVEAEPAEPQQAGAEGHERHVVRPEALLGPTDPPPEHDRQGKRGRTGVDVHRGTTREVELADRDAEEAAAPDHVRDRDVGQGEPAGRKHEPADELGAVGDRTTDQGHGDDGEHHLECEHHIRGDRQGGVERVAQLGRERLPPAVLGDVTDDAGRAVVDRLIRPEGGAFVEQPENRDGPSS
jgi:hypothetical protein